MLGPVDNFRMSSWQDQPDSQKLSVWIYKKIYWMLVPLDICELSNKWLLIARKMIWAELWALALKQNQYTPLMRGKKSNCYLVLLNNPLFTVLNCTSENKMSFELWNKINTYLKYCTRGAICPGKIASKKIWKND